MSYDLAAAIKAAAGNPVQLPDGPLGDLDIRQPCTLIGSPRAVASSVRVIGTHNVTLRGFTIAQPFVDGAITTNSAALFLYLSQDVLVDGLTLLGPIATSGADPAATAQDRTGNVVGYPTSRGVTVQNCARVTVRRCEVSRFFKGLVNTSSDDVTVAENHVHHMRTTAIVGGGNREAVIGNRVHSCHPWAIGTSWGDHADFLTYWTGSAPFDGFTVRGNVFSRGDGANVLGMWTQASEAAPIANVVIEENVFLGCANQAISLQGVHGGRVARNILLQTDPTVRPVANPAILLKTGTTGVEVLGNVTLGVSSVPGVVGNTVGQNNLVQTETPGAPGYYDPMAVKAMWSAMGAAA